MCSPSQGYYQSVHRSGKTKHHYFMMQQLFEQVKAGHTCCYISRGVELVFSPGAAGAINCTPKHYDVKTNT